MHYTINIIDQLKHVLTGYRKVQGLSQKDMATKLCIKQQSYQYLESNPHKVSVGRLFRVLTLLNVKLHLSESIFNIVETVQNSKDT
jgi:HTH-type transcriptional regulator/antitoxin HipB